MCGGERVKGPEEERLPLFSPLQLRLSASGQVADFRTPTHQFPENRFFFSLVLFCFDAFFSSFQVVSALEANPTARRTQLHHKLEQVIALVEDNIYECCSEA